MKQLLMFLILIIINHCVSAQDNDVKIVGHYKNEYFVLQKNSYYVVERLSPLKYSSIKYDTLFPVSNVANTFKGEVYTLLLKNNTLCLINKNYKREVMRLKTVDDKAIENRNRKYNFFYHTPYEVKISQHARLLSEQNKDKYESFDKDREKVYDKANELGIEDFQTYFDTFLKKYNLE